MGLANALTEAVASDAGGLDEAAGQDYVLKKLSDGQWHSLTDVARGFVGHFKKVQKAAEVLTKRGKIQTKRDSREGDMLKLAEGEARDMNALFSEAAKKQE
jgi:hypothetical protein